MHPDFRSPAFLVGHIRHTLGFYEPRCVDPEGGFYHCYKNDGTLYDKGTRTLVASCRFVINYAWAYARFRTEVYRNRVLHGLDYLQRIHRNPRTGGYAWKIVDGQVLDDTNHCYGLAFVLLAHASATKAGIAEARPGIAAAFELMEQHFWLPAQQKYANEADGQWQLRAYRGQNDNMHACEALMAAYEATGEARYVQRAELLARSFTLELAAGMGGQVWEHYHADWSIDPEYARGDHSNNIRPWGVQTGHQTEWAKLLLILDTHLPSPWHLPRAREMFDLAVARGWDAEHGGLIYGYGPDGVACDRDKYFWVQAESIAAAARLATRVADATPYWEWYDRLWAYAWEHFVDHEHGAWYRILTPENRQYDDRKSYSNKADYHTMGACYEVLRTIGS